LITSTTNSAFWSIDQASNQVVLSPTISTSQVVIFWTDNANDPITGYSLGPQYVMRLLGSYSEAYFTPNTPFSIFFGDGTIWDQPFVSQNALPYQAAQPGMDWIGGGYGADYLVGGTGNETLVGMDGNDILDGGKGNDLLDGGMGSDTYVLAAGGGSDTVMDLPNWYNSDTNRIVVAPSIAPDQVELFYLDNALDPSTGSYLGTQFVLRLQGTKDEMRFAPDVIQTIVFADGTTWSEQTINLLAVPKTNEAPTGEVVISGWAEQGQTLHVSNTLSDGDGMGPLNYQWLANGAAIFGATAESYTLTANELGKNISVLAQYLDGYGTQESVLGAATATVAPTNLNWTGTSGANTFVGSRGHDTLYGLAGNDTLYGLAGNDVLIGGAGVDKLDGGEGADIYLVNARTEHLTGEFSDTGLEGQDEVRFAASAASTLTLYANDTGIERVVIGSGMFAEANTNGTVALKVNASLVLKSLSMIGNAGANTLTGTAFDDSLDGGWGVDTLIGGAGNDTYWVDNVSDRVTESSAAGGVDSVIASSTFRLTANVENLALTGVAAISAYGNALGNVLQGNDAANTLAGYAGNDTLTGGDGNDRLLGGLGNDLLTGGSGNDIFRFAEALSAQNADTISDFGSGLDKVQLENAIYTKLATTGTLSSAYFAANASGTAMDANDYVLYNTTTGKLSYDADGSGSGAAVDIALLVGVPSLSASHILVS
jgi:Ca2+-binding RTX toxin-like protein